MALGDIEVSIITVRKRLGRPDEHVVVGKPGKIQAACDAAVQGNGKVAVTDANTGRRYTIDLNAPDAETYSVKRGTLR